MPRAALPLLLFAVLAAEEGFDPAAHPALQERRLTGWTAPIAVLDLAPEVGGRLALVGPQPGERLAGDAPALRLDATFAELAARQAEAALAAARAGQAARQAEARRTASDLDLARREERRSAELAASGAASPRAVDTAESAARSAALAAEAARAAETLAEAEQAAAAARLGEARERLARHAVAGPAGWTVLARLLEPGALVQPGQAVLRLADTSTLLVAFRCDEAELAALRQRAAAGDLALRFAAGGEVPARLRRIDVAFDPVSRKRLVELLVDGAAAPEASGGLEAALTLAVAEPGAVAIPGRLVSWRLEQAWVRSAGAGELPLRPRRRLADGGVVVAADALPPGTRLLPPAGG